MHQDELLSPGGESAPPPHESQRLRTDVFLTFGVKMLVLALNSITTIVVARALGPEGRGTVYVALGLTLILSQVGTLGLGVANAYVAARIPAALPRLTTMSLLAAVVVGTVLIVAGIVLRVAFPGALPNLSRTELWIALSALPPALTIVYLQGILLGLGRMVAYNGVEAVQALGTLVALLAGLAAFDVGPTGTLAVIAAGFYLAAAAYVLLLLRERGRSDAPSPLGLVRSMLVFSTKIYLASLGMFLLLRLDMLMVNAYLGKEEAGQYSAATAIADALIVLPVVVGLNLLPRVARGGEWRPTAEVFSGVAVIYGAICVLSVLLARPGIEFLFGPDFAPAVGLYYWLVPGIFSLGMISILAHHFAGRGMPTTAVVIWLPGLVLNIAINVAFLRDEGTYIASLSSSVAYTIVLLLAMGLFAREASFKALIPSVSQAIRLVRVSLSRG